MYVKSVLLFIYHTRLFFHDWAHIDKAVPVSMCVKSVLLFIYHTRPFFHDWTHIDKAVPASMCVKSVLLFYLPQLLIIIPQLPQKSNRKMKKKHFCYGQHRKNMIY